MTNGDPVVDLDVSGPTARSIASSILSIVDGEADGVDQAAVSVDIGTTTITLTGTGPRSDEIIPQMVSSIDWDSEGVESLSVVLRESTGEQFAPPENPESGDRVTPWESPPVDNYTSVTMGTNRYLMLQKLDSLGPLTATDLAEEINGNNGTVSSSLSTLFNEHGLLDRARVHQKGNGGLKFIYRLNDHGVAVVNDE